MTSFPAAVKFALVSHVLPPSSSGQAVVLYRLLRDRDPKSYCLISAKDYGPSEPLAHLPDGTEDRITRRLDAPYYCLPAETHGRVLDSLAFRGARRAIDALRKAWRLVSHGMRTGRNNSRCTDAGTTRQQKVDSFGAESNWKTKLRSTILALVDRFDLQRQIKERARAILRIVQREKCSALVACSGDAVDLPAAFLAAHWAGVPFFPYMFDDYARQFVPETRRRFAESVCLRMMKEAAGVVVPNEFLAIAYRKTYQVESVIVPNPIDDTIRLPMPRVPDSPSPRRIVFTGAVYEAHFDAFANLIDAVRTLGSQEVEIHIYTSCDPTHLARHGIQAPAVVHSAVPNERAQELQRSADILFLPLAFSSPFPDIIRTSAPGKMGELLASGRPILVHAPADSFVSWYCRKHQCAAVADEFDAALLQQTLMRLLQDKEWTASLIRNAGQRAQRDFGLALARIRFFDLITRQAG